MWRGDWPALLAVSDQAADIAERIENIWAGFWATLHKGYARFRTGDENGGLALVRQAVRGLEASGGGIGIAFFYSCLAELLHLVGHIEESLAYANKAIDHMHLACWLFLPHRVRAMAASRLSSVDWSAVESDMQNSLSYATSCGYRPEVALIHFHYAELYRTKGDLARARAHLEDSVTLFTELDMPWWIGQAVSLRLELGTASTGYGVATEFRTASVMARTIGVTLFQS